MFKIFKYILLLIAIPFSVKAGDGDLLKISQVTTHPSVDFSPSISPDGRWLAFTSDREGNLDIWVKRLPRGDVFRITRHYAEDRSPVWLPDGRRIAFVSKRRDAKGDIWLVSLKVGTTATVRGRPIQLTNHLGMDTSPTFSPDGKKMVYVSDRGGRSDLWIMDIESGRSYKLTDSGALWPCWSPIRDEILYTSYRYDRGGDIFLMRLEGLEPVDVLQITEGRFIDSKPAWSPDGNSIVFLRKSIDTDGDGMLTPMDKSSLWQLDLRFSSLDSNSTATNIIEITTDIYNDDYPSWGTKERIFFASDRGGGLDIWTIPAGGLFPRAESADDQYQKALQYSIVAESDVELHQSVLGYNRVIDYFPLDSLLCAKAFIQTGEIFLTLGDSSKACELFRLVEQRYSGRRREAATAGLRIAASAPLKPEERIEKCMRVIENYPEQKQVIAEAWIVLGDIYKEIGEEAKSIFAYSQTIGYFPEEKNMCAQARLRIGDLFNSQGQRETATQSYLSVLREYGRVPLWRKRAGKRLLDQITGSPEERIKGYQKLIQEAGDFPSLIAEAQLSIGRTLSEMGKLEQAVREFQMVEKIVPSLLWAKAESKIMQADVYAAMGEELKSIILLEEVMDRYGSLEGGRYGQTARERLFKLFLESAERLKDLNDISLSLSRYRKALKIKPFDIRAHRGLVETMYRSGKIDRLLLEYDRKLHENPRNTVLLYAKGLALSYKGESESKILAKSNEYLQRALAEDYRLIYPYRTLSFNYELMEKLAEKKSKMKHTTLYRIGHTVISPVRWLIGLLPFVGGEEKPHRYYEKAIQALTTAVELNDENKDPKMEALLLQNLANNFYNLGEYGYKKAFKYYLKRLEFDTTFSQPLEKSLFFERAGHCGVVIDEPEIAIGFLKRAVKIYNDLGREYDATRNLRMLAFIYHLSGNYENAIDVYMRIVSLDKRAGRWREVERDYRNISYNFYLLNEPADALEYGLKAEKILKRWKIPMKSQKGSSLRIEILGFSIPIWRMEGIGGALSEGLTLADEAALLWALLSKSHESLKEYLRAIDYEMKRLEIFKKRKERLAQRICYNRLGMLFYKMGDFENSWKYFYLSWDENRKRKETRGERINSINLANVALAESSVSGMSEKIEMAIKILEKDIEDGKVKNARERIIVFNMLGSLWMKGAGDRGEVEGDLRGEISGELERLESLKNAEYYFGRGLEIATRERYPRERAILLKNLGELAWRAGDYRRGIACLEESINILKQTGDENLLWRVMYGMANMVQKLQERDSLFVEKDPIYYYTKAINMLEATTIDEQSSDEYLSDSEEKWNLFVDAAFAMLERGRIEESLETIERGREKQIADIIVRYPLEFKLERHKIAWGNMRFLRSRLNRLRRDLACRDSTGKDLSYINEIKRQIDDFEKEYRNRLKELRSEDEVLAYLCGAEPVDLKKIMKILPDNCVAVSYLLGSKEGAAWIIRPDTIEVVFLDADAHSISREVDELVFKIKNDTLISQVSVRLYERILRPLVPLIDNKDLVIIIPDGILWNVPFGLLSDGNKYFQDSHEIVYVPSLSLYRLAFKRRRVNQENGLVVGRRSDSGPYKGMMQLTSKMRFVEKTLVNDNMFKETLMSADVIHLEGRLEYDNTRPLKSTIHLSSRGGRIVAHDVFSMDIRASLLSLFSGDYHIHKDVPFFHGFLYAGVPTIIVSQWPVKGEQRDLFLRYFYGYLGHMSASRAVKMAKIRVRERFPAAVAWAGFRLIGYTGMEPDDKIRFARENLMSVIKNGFGYEKEQEYKEAIKFYQQALDLALAMDDSVMIRRIRYLILRASKNGGLWSDAIPNQKVLLLQARQRGDYKEIMMNLNNLVTLYFKNNDYDSAAVAELEIISLISKQKNLREVALHYEQLAFIFEAARRYDDAIESIQKALDIYIENSDSLGMGRALIRRGRFELEKDRYWEARRDLLHGISVLKSFSDLMRRERIEMAAGYQLLGVACEKLTKYSDALKYQQKSSEIYNELNMREHIAQTLQHSANVYWKIGDYRNALSYQKKAIEVFRQMDNKKMLAVAKSTMGLIYLGLGDFTKAARFEDQALDIAEENQFMEDQATVLKNMGLVAIQQKDFIKAYEAFRRAGVIDSTLGFRRGLAYDCRNMGDLLVRMDRAEEGINFLKRGLSLSRMIDDKRNEIYSLYSLGSVNVLAGNKKEALRYLDSARVEAERYIVPEIKWRIHKQLGGLLSKMRRDEQAMSEYRAAVDIVEKMRGELKVEAFKQGFLDDKMDLYIDVIRYLDRRNMVAEAFNFVERARSRNFIDLLANKSIVLARAQDEMLDKERRIRLEIREIQDRLNLLYRSGESSKSKTDMIAALEDTLQERRRVYEQLLISIQERNPELASFIDVRPYREERIKAMIPDSTLLVEYFLTNESIFCWELWRDGIELNRIDASMDEIRDMVIRFRENIEAHLTSDVESKMLYKILIKPLEKRFSSKSHVVFIPHNILHYLPFSALKDENGKYLLEKVSISLSPSATVLGYCLEKGDKKHSSPDKWRVVAFSNPDLGSSIYDLPFAEKEVRTLRRTFKNVSAFFRKDASENAVRKNVAGYDVIHFACHATYEPEAPLFSALLLSNEGDYDGRLEAHEIFGLKLDCSLVMLSGCETGLARVTKGDEVIGLARSFIFAGTPSIVTSLWKVDDLATAVMVKRFYRYLRRGYSRSEALRMAQLVVMRSVDSHPAAWAAFCLTGDFR